MVVILDLGDGLDEAEQTAYDTTADTIRAEGDTIVLWTDKDPVPEGRKVLPTGVIAWVKPDVHAESPRTSMDNLAKFAIVSPRFDLSECATLDAVARTYIAAAVPDELRKQTEIGGLTVAAIDSFNVDGATVWGYIDRASVMSTLAPPTTPEEVEAFLALDVEERGRVLLESEAHVYRMWATGEVYAVHVQNILNGKDASLHGCYDDSSSHEYLRTVVDEIVGEVA